jgi:hypothetical protein
VSKKKVQKCDVMKSTKPNTHTITEFSQPSMKARISPSMPGDQMTVTTGGGGR